MTQNSLVERMYPARTRQRSAPWIGPRLNLLMALIVMVLLSLGFWWAIWIAVSSLVFD